MTRRRRRQHRAQHLPNLDDEPADGWPGRRHPTPDREVPFLLSEGYTLVVCRSSTHPVFYAIRLHGPAPDPTDHEQLGPTLMLFDNAHSPDEHHVHRFQNGEKQPPDILPSGTAWTDAVANAEAEANRFIAAAGRPT